GSFKVVRRVVADGSPGDGPAERRPLAALRQFGQRRVVRVRRHRHPHLHVLGHGHLRAFPPDHLAGVLGRRRPGRRGGGDLESQMGFNPKLNYPSPKMTVCTSGVSVVMPGDRVPTFIARPAPMPCPPERVLCPLHQHLPVPHHPAQSTSSNRSSSSAQ
ncbi:uncharacterized protein J3R85_006854, partial [Psidium guajava]